MGLAYVKVRVYNPADLAKSEVVELVVDGGATFTSIPRSVLEEIGMKPIVRRKLEVHDGDRRTRHRQLASSNTRAFEPEPP